MSKQVPEQDWRCARSQRIAALETLLQKVEFASEGSPELDSDFARTFPSAPTNVTRSIDALVRMIEIELPGWWWTFGYCTFSNDASLYPPGSARFRRQFSHASLGLDGRSGPQALALFEKWGKLFDEGFHCDLRGGTVVLSMLIVFLRAQIAIAKAGVQAGSPSGWVVWKHKPKLQSPKSTSAQLELFGAYLSQINHA
jgi:hypothetical protein